MDVGLNEDVSAPGKWPGAPDEVVMSQDKITQGTTNNQPNTKPEKNPKAS